MKIKCIFLTIMILVTSISVEATSSLPSSITVSVESKFIPYELENKTVYLRNIDTNKFVFKKTNNDSAFTFELSELVEFIERTQVILGYICMSNDNSYDFGDGFHLECDGYYFYLPIYSNMGSSIKLIFWNNDREIPREEGITKFNISSSDNNMYFCAQYIYRPDASLIYKNHELINRTKDTCTAIVTLNKTTLPEDPYWFAFYAGDAAGNQILRVYSFYQKDIEIKNPYDVPAKATFEIVGADCFFFESGGKVFEVQYASAENKKINVFCPNQDELKRVVIQKSFIQNNFYGPILKFNGENALTSLVLSILGNGVFYWVHNPKSGKKKITLIIILVSIIIYILLQVIGG